MAEPTYPIAETFLSPQGEGHWTGTLMQFIRFAGCSVGRPFTETSRNEWIQLHPTEILQPYQEKCCSGIGEDFVCDTNYQMAKKMSITELCNLVPKGVEHICLTGGEPVMRSFSLPLLILKLIDEDGAFDLEHKLFPRTIHIETSGTISFKPILSALGKRTGTDIWWTVSPKAGFLLECLDTADEIKILVGSSFNENKFFETFHRWIGDNKIWLSPINGEHTLDKRNAERCLELQLRYPSLKITTQMHKIWGCR